MSDKQNIMQNGSFTEWGQSSLGLSLFSAEQKALQKFLPAMHGEIAVQIDIPGIPLMLGSCDMEHKFHLLSGGDTDTESSPSTEPEIQMLYASTDNILPFASSSIDLCLLPHMLDFANDPHVLLRECKESLVSGGHLVIMGFNPYSLWGGRKLFSSQHPPWNGHNFSVYRIRDWLSLLDFHICGGMMLYYPPPIQNTRLRERFEFMAKVGDRWWPMLAAVYLLVAQKRDAGMTVIDLSESFKKRSFLNIAEPAAKSCFKYGIPPGTIKK